MSRLLSGWVACLAIACTSVGEPPPPRSAAPSARLETPRADPLVQSDVVETPEPRTVEDHWILHLYTWLHRRNYQVSRLDFPGSDGQPAVAHLSLPERTGPHPVVLVFPILAGSHVVSEGMAKALVRRGYAVVRVERRPLFPEGEEVDDFSLPASRLRTALLDGRRLLDWLESDPRFDPERLAVAGVSLGGIMAASLMGIDPRVRAGFFVMAGGGLAEILYDSTERPVRRFRDRVLARLGTRERDAFLATARPHTLALDPLTYAAHIDPRRVLLISGRFDRVVPPERTRALWEALGGPRWLRFPAGHYQLFPFFWWAVARGADHLDAVLGPPGLSAVRRAQPPERLPGERRSASPLLIGQQPQVAE